MLGFVMTAINPLFRDALLPAMVIFAIYTAAILGLPDPLVQAREAGRPSVEALAEMCIRDRCIAATRRRGLSIRRGCRCRCLPVEGGRFQRRFSLLRTSVSEQRKSAPNQRYQRAIPF